MDELSGFYDLLLQKETDIVQDFKDFGITYLYYYLHPILSGGDQMALLHQRDMP
jgi:hypothetical protein